MCAKRNEDGGSHGGIAINAAAYKQAGRDDQRCGGGGDDQERIQVQCDATVILAIWFQKISSLTVVWMANRDFAVDAHSFFRLTTAGQFALFNGSGVVAWSTPSYRGMRSDVVRGEFQQSGNLLLQNQTSKDVLWQSFDHRTDTLIPGQQFSRTTNALWSWRSLSDASTGNFLLAMNSSNNVEMYFVITGAEYWTSDQLTLISFPAGSASAELNQTGALNIAVNSTMLQSYRASDYGSNITNLRRRLTLNAEGNFAMYTWSEAEGAWLMVSDACQVICTSPNVSDLSQYVCSCPQGFLRNDFQDWTQGFFRQIPALASCNSAPNSNLTVQMDSFNNVNYLGPASFIDQVASAADCGALCLQNCSCVCASYGSDRVCWIHSDMQYGAQSDPNQTYIFLLKLAQKSSAILEGLPAAKA
ncbi:hypothetical protein L7F22_067766 [Adiantum nelumboides]|nr:hypothetical protein [Adiantum nelumboides]